MKSGYLSSRERYREKYAQELEEATFSGERKRRSSASGGRRSDEQSSEPLQVIGAPAKFHIKSRDKSGKILDRVLIGNEHPLSSGVPPRLWNFQRVDGHGLYTMVSEDERYYRQTPGIVSVEGGSSQQSESLVAASDEHVPEIRDWCIESVHHPRSLVYQGLDKAAVSGVLSSLPSNDMAGPGSALQDYPHITAALFGYETRSSSSGGGSGSGSSSSGSDSGTIGDGARSVIAASSSGVARLSQAEAKTILDKLMVDKTLPLEERIRVAQSIRFHDETETSNGAAEHFSLRRDRIRASHNVPGNTLHKEGYDVFLEQLRRRERELIRMKRELELEGARGPTPGWHEWRSKEFAVELAKNNYVLKHPQETRATMMYRHRLMTEPISAQR